MKVIRISELQMKDIINVSDGKGLKYWRYRNRYEHRKIESIIIAKQTRTLGILEKT